MNKEYRELMFTRNIACNLIKLAVKDAQNTREYLRANNRNNQEANRISALHFLDSRAYEDICCVLNLPADKIRAEALNPTSNKGIKDEL